MQEMQVQPLGREDPLEKGMAIHSSILVLEIHEQRNLASFSLWATLLQRFGQTLATKWASLVSAGKESACNAKT